MAEALLSDWQGFKVDWIIKSLGAAVGSPPGTSLDGDSHKKDYTDGLGDQRKDGSYEI